MEALDPGQQEIFNRGLGLRFGPAVLVKRLELSQDHYLGPQFQVHIDFLERPLENFRYTVIYNDRLLPIRR